MDKIQEIIRTQFDKKSEHELMRMWVDNKHKLGELIDSFPEEIDEYDMTMIVRTFEVVSMCLNEGSYEFEVDGDIYMIDFWDIRTASLFETALSENIPEAEIVEFIKNGLRESLVSIRQMADELLHITATGTA